MYCHYIKTDELKMVINTFRHGAREAYFDNYNAEEYNTWGKFIPGIG